MELTMLQLLIIGVVASGLTQVAKLLAAKFGKDTSRLVTTAIVVVISVALSYVWMLPVVPPSTDPMEFATNLLTVALQVFGFATLIYNVLLEKVVFEALGWTKAKFLI